VGLEKSAAIELFHDIANRRELSLDDLEKDVNEIAADGLLIPTRQSFVEAIVSVLLTPTRTAL
jgi:hypothetical protein